MVDQGKGRFDRSRYGSGSKRSSSERIGGRADSGRRADSGGRANSGGRADHDSFYDDMRISAADPTASRTVSDYSRKAVEERLASDSPRKASSRDGYSRRYSSDEGSYSARLERNDKKRHRKLIIGIVAIAAVVLIGAGAAFAYVNSISKNLHAGVDDELRNALVKTDMANEPFYMLLLGTDGSAERDDDPEYGGGYRSDSMMLARIDPVKKKATLISIGRDILVNMGDGYGEQKINAAYAIGGPAKAVKVVSELAGVPISHYAQVDFDGFAAMVDALGGVEVDVPMSFDDHDAGGALNAGLQTLNGQQALMLCRMRNAYTTVSAHPDAMRAANQRLVLSAIAKKLLASDVATIATTTQAMSQYVTTDLELADIIGLAQIMKGLDSDTDIYTASVPTTSKLINDGWYEFVNKDEWNKMMKRVDAGEPPVEEAVVDEATGTVLATAGAGTATTADKYAVVMVKNATNISGLAAQTRSKLMDAGFVNVSVGDITDSFSYPETVVVYDEPSRVREAAEIVEVIGQGKAMENDGSYLLGNNDFLVVIGDDWKK